MENDMDERNRQDSVLDMINFVEIERRNSELLEFKYLHLII